MIKHNYRYNQTFLPAHQCSEVRGRNWRVVGYILLRVIIWTLFLLCMSMFVYAFVGVFVMGK